MNLIITNACRNRCSYCFASEIIAAGSAKQTHMSMANFEFCLEFLRRSGVSTLKLLGGEPMLHPQIRDMFILASSNVFVKHIELFTSGRFPTEHLQSLAEVRPKLGVVFNLNEERDYTQSALEETMGSLRFIVDSGIPVTLSYTIYRPDFSPEGHIRVLMDYGIHKLRWSLASSGFFGSNASLQPKKQTDFGKALSSFLLSCADLCIETHVDCVLPPCLFDAETLGHLQWINPGFGKSRNVGICHPAIDVGPDLEVWRCFGRTDIRGRLKDFENLDVLTEFLARQDEQLRWSTMKGECLNCDAAKRHFCQGGCLGTRRVGGDSSEGQGRLALENDSLVFSGTELPSQMCDRLFKMVVSGDNLKFLAHWGDLRNHPCLTAYPGRIVLDALAAEIRHERGAALRFWRMALPSLTEEKRQWVVERISELARSIG